ncbi:YrdB family protein [Kitasatospora sp. NPDC050543]|uniref:YrdB family protein n=1 Tax=Kitasatospora sp. NPDC050543 TaxID=3364054 RepID=UPI0037B3D934
MRASASPGGAGGWTPLTVANAALAFALEIGMLAALCYWGIHTGRGPVGKTLLAIGAPVLAGVVWGLFLAGGGPRYELPVPARIVIKLAVFGLAALALSASGRTTLGLVLGALALLTVAVEYTAR